MRRLTDRSLSEVPQPSHATVQVAPSSEGIDVRRVAPNTAVIVEPAHMSRRSFGLANGSALATVPSMIDDNELASQTVLDESEVFDDPFYEALVAVGLGDEDADDDSVSDDAAPQAPEADATSAHAQESAPAPAAHDQGVSEDAAPDADAVGDDVPLRGAHARRPDAAKADTAPAAAPKDDTAPYEFSLATGSALAMLPSMIDDNESASQTVVEPFEVFDDPFYEALMAVEPQPAEPEVGQPAKAEETATNASEDETSPSQNKAAIEPEHADAGEETGESSVVVADEVAEPLYTTASALVDDEPEDAASAKADAAAKDDADAKPAVDAPSVDSGEAAAAADAAAVEPKAAPDTAGDEGAGASAAEQPDADKALHEPEEVPVSESEISPAAADAEPEKASEQPEPAPASESASDTAAPAVDDGLHAAAQEPEAAPVAEAQAETLPDDESVADAVDEMVISADPDEGKAPADASGNVPAAPKKRGLWSRIKGFFRRNR